MPTQFSIKKEKLLLALKDAIEQDNALRAKYHIGNKFQFVQDRLQYYVDELVANTTQDDESGILANAVTVADDEQVVYVYLFNAHGMEKQTWQKMLNQNVFYEYSVNRPIYAVKKHVESFINNKLEKMQHAYLAIAVKKEYILPEEVVTTDSLGHLLIKVKEGALQFNRLLLFHYNDQDYYVNNAGGLEKKQ